MMLFIGPLLVDLKTYTKKLNVILFKSTTSEIPERALKTMKNLSFMFLQESSTFLSKIEVQNYVEQFCRETVLRSVRMSQSFG
jgi:hypothetical protein